MILELKKYQKKVLDELKGYLLGIKKFSSQEKAAGLAFMERTDLPYKWLPDFPKVPFVCFKVPTAGGKTLIASHSVPTIFENYLPERCNRGLVMWFVPTDAIKTQTLKNLKDRKHPYREVLDKFFENKVNVFDLAEAKAIKKDDLVNNMCIVVTTLSAFRRNDKEWLKAYQDNGALMNHFENINGGLLDILDKDKEGQVIYSLVNLIKMCNPLVIVDEGHNAKTELSFEMLKNINPCFVMEYTATPKKESNVLISIPAYELKEAKMIKMPIYLVNKTPWQETIFEGVEKRNNLEKMSRKIKGEYIRPIMLLQAEQEKEASQKIYVDKILQFLVEDAKIPREQIAIKTATRDEIANFDLMDRKCPIRYIITVNALREGWDCPFAYILASVANLGSKIAVEQTIGRVMRLPYAREKSAKELNYSYVFAATRNFSQASEAIIKGLENNGYSREDLVVSQQKLSLAGGETKKQIKDKKAEVPYLCIKEINSFRRLNYLRDLIGNCNIFDGQNYDIDFKIIDESQIVKVDITKEGEIIRDAQGKLGLVYRYKEFTKEELLTWLVQKIQRTFISVKEMQLYISKILEKLLEKYSLSQLSVERFILKDAIERKIDFIIDEITTSRFKELEKKRLLIASGEAFFMKDNVSLPRFCSDSFQKHFYKKAGEMNTEELDLAFQLDGLDNVFWWFRNPESGGFYLQGWLKNKFYPDFILKTKQNNYFVLEYKGAQFEESKDTEYKNALGQKWQELGDKKHFFELVEKKNMVNIVNKIARM